MDSQKLKQQNKIVLLIVALLVVAGLTIHQYFNYALQPVSPNNRASVTVTIPKGATDDEVGAILKKKRLVRSSYVFSYYLQTHKTSGIKAGQFTLDRSLTVPQITRQLQNSRAAKVR
ncbi:endolytic transglycosylase MltG [Limosilactobacillus viscerum]|uniref:endolytic transglycosylase MltG n=1 Tax=Limosilactobacillus viscerum TaxID=2993450 RepID=UPI0024B8D106|nr:endolytic transglycosylase MltG [Limosilactobacillus viscerum]